MIIIIVLLLWNFAIISQELDFEVELAFVIGKTGKTIKVLIDKKNKLE